MACTNATGFYMSILFPDTLLLVYIRSLVESLGSFKYRIMLSVNRDSLNSSLTICINFSFLIALAKTLNTVLNKRKQYLGLILALDKIHSVFTYLI